MTTPQQNLDADALNEYSVDGSGDAGLDDEWAIPQDETEEEPEAPATEPAPEPEPSGPTPEEIAALREENARLSREAQQRQQEAEEARVQNAAMEYAQTRINYWTQQGFDEQTARQMGIMEAREQVSIYRSSQAHLRATRLELAQEFNIPMEQLMQYQDENSMRAFAQQYASTSGPQARRIKELEARLASLEKGRVPAQNYNQSAGGGGAGSDQEINNRYGRGEINWSPRVAAARKRLGYD